MIPRPPTWISSSITTWPNGDQYVPVSTTARPVTQTHEVAVNSADTNGGSSPPAVAKGSISSAVPIDDHDRERVGDQPLRMPRDAAALAALDRSQGCRDVHGAGA